MRILRAGLAIATIPLLAACVVTPSVKATQVGLPAPEREPTCSLELVQDATDLEQIGAVTVIDEEQRAYNDPQLLALVKPEACKLGGEFVSATSQSVNNGVTRVSRSDYVVWCKKRAPTGPVKF